jgi:hypothetical protein
VAVRVVHRAFHTEEDSGHEYEEHDDPVKVLLVDGFVAKTTDLILRRETHA